MKNFILLALFLKLLFTQDNIEGRWHLVGYENSIMYEFIHTDQQVNIGLKYTIYSLDSSFNNLEDNLGGTPNPYNITGNKIIIDKKDPTENPLASKIAKHVYDMAKLSVGGLDQEQIINLQNNNAELISELLNSTN